MRDKFEQLRLFENTGPEEIDTYSKPDQPVNSKSPPMPIDVVSISKEQAEKIVALEEGQFGDVKAIEIAPADLTKTISAFANSDGGDLYIGIDENKTTKTRSWRGFANQEAANGHLQIFEELFPLSRDYLYQFLNCSDSQGLVLHVQVNKTRGIVRASNRIPYIRRGAQKLPQDTSEKLKRLEYSKGVTSFETEPLNIPVEIITRSGPMLAFIRDVVPQQSPETFLYKQILLADGRPTVAAALLFAEEPQAALPKHCGIKVYRYKTTGQEGFREALAFTPRTVEGWLYEQIKQAVQITTEIIESVQRLGSEGLERVEYPSEALHETITNAVLHRDYSIKDDVHIRIFDNRVEVESPGRLPKHITVENILDEREARNGAIVRLLNRFPNPPNQDVGEGLNTAFAAMHKRGLKEPTIIERENSVLVILKHEKLASPEEAIMDYLSAHDTIRNKKAREITHVQQDYAIKKIFGDMVTKGMIEQVPGTKTGGTQYRLPRK